jgi:hypothetical protein
LIVSKAEKSDTTALAGDGMKKLLVRNAGMAFVLGVILMFAAVSSSAQQKVYRWVDEDGVVHVSDRPPDDTESIDTETFTTAPPTTRPPVVQPVSRAPAISASDDERSSTQATIKSPPLVEKTDITQLSLEDLDRRCEDARDEMIAPLREGEIASCKQEKRTDPNWCESFYADYGDGGRTKNGSIRPRMFDDLPECVDAQQERNRRKL